MVPTFPSFEPESQDQQEPRGTDLSPSLFPGPDPNPTSMDRKLPLAFLELENLSWSWGASPGEEGDEGQGEVPPWDVQSPAQVLP